MTAQPIAVTVTRHKCPFCPRTAARPVRAREHMARCWFNPEVRGCKTCKHFEQDPGEPDVGLMGGEGCAVGVDLTGRPQCAACKGWGTTPGLGVTECPECGGDGAEIKPGPIVHCEKWEKP
jgi:hypothetical protein